MANYKQILSGYVNERKSGDGHYLAITNRTDEDYVIPAGQKVFLNRTPEETLKQYPKAPHYSMSEKIEEFDLGKEADLRDSEVDTTKEIPF